MVKRSMLQQDFPGFSDLDDIIEQLSNSGAEQRGAIFTRPEVVDFILDLVGYTRTKKLHTKSILEPSFGSGEFLIEVVRRLLASYKRYRSGGYDFLRDLGGAVRAVELHKDSFEEVRSRILEQLTEFGVPTIQARRLVDEWLMCGDYLLKEIEKRFEFIVGNPPYVRQELIPNPLLAEYRRRYKTIFDRADLYVPFYERSLGLLAKSGKLGFICSDRWTKNRYGEPLRKLIASEFCIESYIDMVDTDAFLSEVTTYPAITIISRKKPRPVRIIQRPSIERTVLNAVVKDLRTDKTSAAPLRPQPRENGPEQPIRRCDVWSLPLPPISGELMAQGGDFQLQ